MRAIARASNVDDRTIRRIVKDGLGARSHNQYNKRNDGIICYDLENIPDDVRHIQPGVATSADVIFLSIISNDGSVESSFFFPKRLLEMILIFFNQFV